MELMNNTIVRLIAGDEQVTKVNEIVKKYTRGLIRYKEMTTTMTLEEKQIFNDIVDFIEIQLGYIYPKIVGIDLLSEPAVVESYVYKAEIRYHTWPIGWEDVTVKTFRDKESLDECLLELLDWSLSEDNEVKVNVLNSKNEFISSHHYC